MTTERSIKINLDFDFYQMLTGEFGQTAMERWSEFFFGGGLSNCIKMKNGTWLEFFSYEINAINGVYSIDCRFAFTNDSGEPEFEFLEMEIDNHISDSLQEILDAVN
jgi:hypothetical protein